MIGIPRPNLFGYVFNNDTAFLALAFVILLLVLAITALLVRGSFGRSLMAIRDSESAAQTYGKHVNAVKTLSVAVSAGLAGVAGSLYAFYMSFIKPESFMLEMSILLMAMVIIGGTGTLFGPIVGAALLMSLPAALTYLPFLPPSELGTIQQIIYGLAMVLLMMFRPGGLVGGRTKGKAA
jgi:branched-chain amino acid transport system permease protein